MKYKFIKENRKEFPVGKMCKVLGVARSGYYRWLKRGVSRYEQENKAIVREMIMIYQDKHKRCYGSPRMTRELHLRGYRCSRPRVARLMRQYGLRSSIKRRYKVTTNSNHTHKISPNLVGQNFTVSMPNMVWVSDITYLWTQEGWAYLTVIIDLYNREVIGWTLSTGLSAEETVIKALYNAIRNRRPVSHIIFHSDRGVQYASHKFRKELKIFKFKQSMSGKGNCYDNAVAESFFHTLKTELIYRKNYESRASLRNDIFHYIEGFYNKIRLHSKLGYVAPATYLQLYNLVA